jgi:hypothetical protein
MFRCRSRRFISAVGGNPPPYVVGLVLDVAAWRFATLFHLLKAADLTFISVWSPTFLVVLMDALPARWTATERPG